VAIRSESGFRYLFDNRFKGSAFTVQGYIKKGSEVTAFALQVSEGRLGSRFKVDLAKFHDGCSVDSSGIKVAVLI
jgi:hypothetical protein